MQEIVLNLWVDSFPWKVEKNVCCSFLLRWEVSYIISRKRSKYVENKWESVVNGMGMHYENEKRWIDLVLVLLEHHGMGGEKLKFEFP